jgi:hypothetical protein
MNDAFYIQQLLIREPLFQFKDQIYDIMWTHNLDNFKSCCAIVIRILGWTPHYETTFYVVNIAC